MARKLRVGADLLWAGRILRGADQVLRPLIATFVQRFGRSCRSLPEQPVPCASLHALTEAGAGQRNGKLPTAQKPGGRPSSFDDYPICSPASFFENHHPTSVDALMGTKIKTHKGTKKRFRLSAKGKAMHRQSGTSHLAKGLSKKRRRNLRGTTAVAECMEPTIHAALNGHSY